MRGILPNLLQLLNPSSEPDSLVAYLFWTLELNVLHWESDEFLKTRAVPVTLTFVPLEPQP